LASIICICTHTYIHTHIYITIYISAHFQVITMHLPRCAQHYDLCAHVFDNKSPHALTQVHTTPKPCANGSPAYIPLPLIYALSSLHYIHVQSKILQKYPNFSNEACYPPSAPLSSTNSCIHTVARSHFLYSIELLQERIHLIVPFDTPS
jgi:hypothetical protein